jgi:uncharacterized repeat protein (TIGR01451 family)
VKSASPDLAWAGKPLTYTLEVTNLGPTAAPVVTLLDVLPAWTALRWNDGGCTLAGKVLICSLGMLDAGEERRVQVVVTPMRLGMVVNQAVVTAEAEELNPEDNFSTVISTVQGYLF